MGHIDKLLQKIGYNKELAAEIVTHDEGEYIKIYQTGKTIQA